MKADILFDGDSEIFDENGGYNTVSGEFSAQLRYDNSGSAGDEGTHTVKILGKDYTVVVPPAPVVYNVAKSGVADLAHNKIDWTVTLSATKGATAVDLKDYEFSDDLSNVGTYVPSSFTVGGVAATPVETGSVITYKFPDPSSGPQEIKFSTTIPDNKYYVNNVNQSISNTAQLLKDNAVVQSGSGTASFMTPKWIEKTGAAKHDPGSEATYDPADQFITWTITANKAQASLDNLTITDVLPSGLDFVSAQWQTSTDGSAWTPGTVVGSEPTDGKYTLPGTTSTMVQLVITSKVSNTGTTVGKTTFNNAATLDWDNKPGGVTLNTGNVGIGIGYDALTKSGSLNKTTREITWTIKADAKNQAIADMRVYDLLVYDPATNLSGTTGWPTGIDTTNVTKRTGLQYVASSGTTTSGTLNVIPILDNGKRVADLIEVTGLSTAAANTIQFKTLIVNPDVYAGNTSKNVDNTASLFTNTTKLRDATGSVTYDSRTLAKELLKREALADPAAGVNSQRTTNAAEGFDYVDKSVIFRLSVNADGLDFNTAKVASNEATDVLGTATVTDTLPAGWEFADIVPGEQYLIFAGNTGSGSSSVAAASTTPEASVSGLTANFSTAGQATFTFTQLDKPYVILVKAKPTGTTLDGYFDSNKTTTITNALNLQAAHWTPGASRSQQVSIKSEILKKSYTGPTNGTLNWSVVYNPNELGTTGESIVDTLPLGLDLRTDAMGKLLLDDGNGVSYIAAKELTPQPDGTLTDGSNVPLALGTNLFYNNATRELLFKIPDHSKAYRLSYLTDITGEIGGVVNHASLTAGNAGASEQQINYAISNADSSATMMRGGWLEVTKTDGLTSAPLLGAEFTLFAIDGSTVIRKAISAADGKLKMKAIPNGDYVLRETAAPSGGYTLEGIDHTVHVDTTGSTVVTTIDGKTGADTNKLTVANHKNNTTGKLVISKTVAGNDGDLTKHFDFTVNFTGAPGVYNYTGTGGAASGTIASGGTISLSHGQGIIIAGLPADATYKVTETNYANEGYKTTSVGAEGVIAADQTQTAVFVNTKDKPGNLIISKTVTGNDGDTAQLFDFTVTLSSPGVYNYTGSGGAANGTITSGGKIALAGGQSITIAGLPAGTTYAVAENDYAAIGYVTTKTGDAGTIVTNDFQSADFVNARDDWFGSLKISKTVTGNAGDKAKKFEFTVTLSAPGVYNYTGSGGAGDDTIKSGDTILLSDGQSITIEGLAKNTTYAVTEASYAADGYVTTKTGNTGAIVGGQEQSSAFVNTKNVWYAPSQGSLTINKTVTGNGGDRGKKFSFKVVLDGTNATYKYSGSGGNGTIQSGGTVTLAHGQSVTIAGLPAGTSYTVSEEDYAADGYVTTSTGSTGTIQVDATQVADFVNNKESQEPEQPGNEGSGGDGGDNGGDGDNSHNGGDGSSGGSTDSPSGGSTDSPSGGSTDTDGGNGGTDGNSGTADNGSQQGAGSGTPKTGDNNHKQAGQIGLIFFGAALVVLMYANNAARRRSKTGKRQ
ncbi:DUF5979 domain-containing protein [Cohnella sp. OV330]|uniref:beta strand repeat-containing protein n=1 Tax=Cohnella sp. OV330 TaxID=1855288 RepID=UPI000B7D8499|nr:DUF5979 domain-containing protein [Cohnella sp. OV330]